MEIEEIYLGQFVKPFGIKGELKFLPSPDFWEEVLVSKKLILRTAGNNAVDTRPLEFETFRLQKNCYILKAAGVGSRTVAESLVGGELFISTEQLDVDLPDEALPFQIMGNTVVADDGQPLGEVTSVLSTPVHDVYEVTGERGAFLVPAVPEFILSMDLERAQIVIRPIPGLIGE